MMTRGFAACVGLLLAAAYFNGLPASALTMKECSDKYKAAKAAGNTAKWNDFRKSECGSDASATPAAAAPAAAPAATTPATTEAKPAAEPKAKKKAAKSESETPAAAPAAAGSAVFPTAVSDKYSKETAGKARMHTCLDQYNTNKANNANGGLNWIQKGGGYYSECNKRLKGA
jgi:hypothetical protein